METLRQVCDGRARKNEHGFTLPEVLVTILIMGILFAIATSSWQSVTEGRRATSAANQVASDMRLAHTSATNQLSDWRMVYDDNGDPVNCGTATADYCLVKLDSTGIPVERLPRTLPDGTRILGTNTNNLASAFAVLFPGSNRALEFNPDGSAEAVDGFTATPPLEADPTVRVGADDGDPLNRISVTPSTSRIRIA
jgi:prepilin-type N-terminal cleavage/methylation domain-containing protein